MWVDDHLLAQSHQDLSTHIFIPPYPMVVMARSNPATDCHAAYCQRHNIAITRRLGGGGAVVLYPGCIVLSLGMWVDRPYDNSLFFTQINQCIIRFLEMHLGLAGWYEDGHSDIVFQGRKCLGASLFRSKRYLLYQGSLLVERDDKLIAACLAHPAREPAYRAGKPHHEFLTSVTEIMRGQQRSPLAITGLIQLFQRQFKALLQQRLAPYLRSADQAHHLHLRRRISADYPESMPMLHSAG